MMFTEKGVAPLKDLKALLVDDVSTIIANESMLTDLVDLVVLIYNEVENTGEYCSLCLTCCLIFISDC